MLILIHKGKGKMDSRLRGNDANLEVVSAIHGPHVSTTR
jgi:hypothetical protein